MTRAHRFAVLPVLIMIIWIAVPNLEGNATSAAETNTQATDNLDMNDTMRQISGEVDIALLWPSHTFSPHRLPLIKVASDLNLQAAFGTTIVECDTDVKGAPQCGYLVVNDNPEKRLALWNGNWNEKAWGDPTGLVRLSGSGKNGLRLRLMLDEWGLDLSATHAVSRWERSVASDVTKSTWGVLSSWGSLDMEECDDYDSDLSYEDSDCELQDPKTTANLVNDGDDIGKSDQLPNTVFGFDRAVAYVSKSGYGWKWQSALANATYGVNHESAAAFAFTGSYKSDAWRMQWQTVSRAGGYRSSTAPAELLLEGVLAGTTRLIAAEAKAKWLTEAGDGLSTVWRLTVGGHRGIGAGSISSLYTTSQLKRAKQPAWRLQAEWKTTTNTTPRTCGEGSCPWLVSGDKLTSWKLGFDGVALFLRGVVATRLLLGESRNGRMNWWQHDPLGNRALSPMSDSALSFAAQTLHSVGDDYSFGITAVYAEDVQFEPAMWEGPRAVYWLLQPKLTRIISDSITAEYGLSWYGGDEYTGEPRQVWMPSIQYTLQY